MMKIFIAGSRRLSRLNALAKRRIDTMIEKGMTILVGDANGADKAVQEYLASKDYRRVYVFCAGGKCRSNVGRWPTRDIPAPPGARGFEFFSAKDRAMAEEAEYGLMLWDGKSRGTLSSIINMVNKGKRVVVYHAPSKSFVTLRNADQIWKMAREMPSSALRRLPVQSVTQP
jgi:hypothetical protein